MGPLSGPDIMPRRGSRLEGAILRGQGTVGNMTPEQREQERRVAEQLAKQFGGGGSVSLRLVP
jgi:hypothetical protein